MKTKNFNLERKQDMINFIMDYWFLIVIACVIGYLIGRSVKGFKNLPVEVKEENIINFLIWAVAKAEEKWGSNTGNLKLREAYALFVQFYPDIALKIPFETFSEWVDKALEKFNEIASKNKKIKDAINPDMVIREPKIEDKEVFVTTTEDFK